jgi:dipeptidyl aminopeptidase/acylaminoacyl peptidase
MKKVLILFSFTFICVFAKAQESTSYQKPSKEVADLLLAPPTPTITVDGKAQYMLVMERSFYPTVEELGQPEFKIAGIRINPNNFSLSRQNFIKQLSLKNLVTGKMISITGLPNNLSVLNPTWNPSENKIAFYNVTATAVDVWVIDIKASTCSKINKNAANIVLSSSLIWLDDATVLYKINTHTAAQMSKKPITPKGPTIQESLGKVAPSVTYQDLIKSPYDEYAFEYLATSQLVKNNAGVETKIGAPAIISSIDLSPDKKYFLTRTINKPFSYLVTVYGFATTVNVTDLNGKIVKKIADLASSETTPSGYDNVQNVARAFDWKDDEAATIIYALPLDSGIMKKNVPFHDVVMALVAPFTGSPKELFKTTTRYSRTVWGNEHIALVTEMLRSKQQYKVSRYDASINTLTTLYQGNMTDAYTNPGTPVTIKNKYNRDVIAMTNNGQSILMNNITGASPKGDLPYLATFDLTTKANTILWRCSEDNFEMVMEVLDINNLKVITRRETEKEVPNYYIRSIKDNSETTITNFTNPYTSMEGVTKEKIKYKRKDGIDLTGDLYLPKGYDKVKDGPLPTLIWAYPREFTSAADASQIRGNQHKFTLLSWGSPVFYVTQYQAFNLAKEIRHDPKAQKFLKDQLVNIIRGLQ